jgi:hypothetical protein
MPVRNPTHEGNRCDLRPLTPKPPGKAPYLVVLRRHPAYMWCAWACLIFDCQNGVGIPAGRPVHHRDGNQNSSAVINVAGLENATGAGRPGKSAAARRGNPCPGGTSSSCNWYEDAEKFAHGSASKMISPSCRPVTGATQRSSCADAIETLATSGAAVQHGPASVGRDGVGGQREPGTRAQVVAKFRLRAARCGRKPVRAAGIGPRTRGGRKRAPSAGCWLSKDPSVPGRAAIGRPCRGRR